MDVDTSSEAEGDAPDGVLSLARELMSAMEVEQVPDHLRKLAEELAAALERQVGGR